MKFRNTLLAISLTTAFSVNAGTSFGSKSQVMDSITFDGNVVYVNSQLVSDADITAVNALLDSGSVVIIDNTDSGTNEDARLSTQRILGFGLKVPAVVAAKINGQLSLKAVSVYGDSAAGRYSDFYDDDAAAAQLRSSINEVKSELIDQISENSSTNATPKSYQTADDSTTLPEKPTIENLKTTNTEIILVDSRSTALSCETPGYRWDWSVWDVRFTDDENKFDPCLEQNSRAALTYTVELMRSEPVQGAIAANYVRVSISPDLGGTGIFLANTLTETENNSLHHHRLLSPIADNYSFNVRSDDAGVRLIGHIPAQENPTSVINETSSVQVGISITVEAGASGGGSGSGNGNVSATYSYNTNKSRTITYETAEYMTENVSGSFALDQAGWSYNRRYEQNKCLWINFLDANPDNCSSTRGIIAAPVFNPQKFSAIAHRNFVPGFVATFYADPDSTGSSNFHVDTKVGVMSLLGIKSWIPFFWEKREIETSHVADAIMNTEFSVDWDRMAELSKQNLDFPDQNREE